MYTAISCKLFRMNPEGLHLSHPPIPPAGTAHRAEPRILSFQDRLFGCSLTHRCCNATSQSTYETPPPRLILFFLHW